MVYEMRVEHLFLRLDGRVFEVLSDNSGYMQRVHVDAVGFAVKGPDRHGRYKALIGTLDGDELHLGMSRTPVELDEAQFQRFSELVKLAHAARDAGPDPW
ncbi:MAG: hypothetical protein JWO02_3534 [Solirubrobacterales bacterium]|nr:hypothetical protein [Solirubrobacterales bacterium]